MRVAFAVIATCLGWACASAEPPQTLELVDVPMELHPPHENAEPPPSEPVCPPGTEQRQRADEGTVALDWWCARGEVPHGPFFQQVFDNRSRAWHELRGEHVDGERHGLVSTEGFYEVEHSGRSRVFLRERWDHGRKVHANEASVRIELDAASPVATRRFAVKARGLPPGEAWEDGPAAIGSFDVEVSASWLDAPADADPGILRAELSAPGTQAPARADAILHSFADEEPPTTGSSLPLGHLPAISATWRACDLAGCELELEVSLRWLAAGAGKVEAYVTTRAVPDTWPAAAPLELRALDGG